MLRRRRRLDVSSCLELLLLVLVVAAIACTRRVPPPLLIILPGPVQHDISLWPDADTVCVRLPPVGAVYVTHRCLSMGTMRALILTQQNADEAP
jgi:hypothetical protein